MKAFISAVLACVVTVCVVLTMPVLAVTPAQEKAFVDTYKKAYETKDAKTLQAMLYTRGADPMALEFYQMMITADLGATITAITLADLTAEDSKKLENGKSPDGRPMKMTLKPIKKLILKTSSKSASGSATGTSESFVAEFEGKLVIPVPAAAK